MLFHVKHIVLFGTLSEVHWSGQPPSLYLVINIYEIDKETYLADYTPWCSIPCNWVYKEFWDQPACLSGPPQGHLCTTLYSQTSVKDHLGIETTLL